MKRKPWYDYLWIAECAYLALGLFNILFAWLGLIFFMTPLLFSIIGGNKIYCNKFCPRGLWLEFLGSKLKLSFRRKTPEFFRSSWFRYGFLTFFMTMFSLMLYSTYQVFAGAPLDQALTLLWAFRVPWGASSFALPWVLRFAYGFYSVMLTSVILGLGMMAVYKPRSWCVICPMGTMTQGICKLRNPAPPSPT